MKFAVTKRIGVLPVLWLALTTLYFSFDAVTASGQYLELIQKTAKEAANHVTDGRYPPVAVQYVSDTVKAIKLLDPHFANFTADVLVFGGEIDIFNPYFKEKFEDWPGYMGPFPVMVYVLLTGWIDRCADQNDGFENIYFTSNNKCGGYSFDNNDKKHYPCGGATKLCRIHWGLDPWAPQPPPSPVSGPASGMEEP